MTVTLPPALAVFVGAVRTGRSPSELDLLHQAVQMLSDRDLRARVQAEIDHADVGRTYDAETVFSEIRDSLAAAADAKANPGRLLSSERMLNWVQKV